MSGDAPLTASLPMDLTKLTVPQLKAVCKERRITGYSKLGKAALLQKLTVRSNAGIDMLPPSSSTVVYAVPQETSRMSVDDPSVAEKPASIKKPRAPKKPREAAQPSPSMQQKSPTAQSADSSLRDHVPSSTADHPISHKAPSPVSAEPNFMPSGTLVGTKRSANLLNNGAATAVPNKKQKTAQKIYADAGAFVADSLPSYVLKSAPVASKQASKSMPPPPVPKTTIPHTASGSKTPVQMQSTAILSKQTLNRLPYVSITKPVTLHNSSVAHPQTTENGLKPILLKAQRFKPLKLKKGPVSPPVPSVETPRRPVSSSLISVMDPAASNTIHLHHLDFPQLSFDSLELVPITLPPKLSNRKHVHRWSIILSGLSDEERRQCALVSRMFRYSGKCDAHSPYFLSTAYLCFDIVYLSAVRLLEQNFSGRRQAHLMLRYPQTMTNMWPYLRLRELERKTRIYAYKESFLAAQYFKGFNPISEHLYACPDNDKQLVVAIRSASSAYPQMLSRR
jgi:hypothetical protein